MYYKQILFISKMQGNSSSPIQVLLQDLNGNYSWQEYEQKNRQIHQLISSEFKQVEQSVQERRRKVQEGKRRLRELYCAQPDLDIPLSSGDEGAAPKREEVALEVRQLLDLQGLRGQNLKMAHKVLSKDKKELFQARITLLNETRKNLFDKYSAHPRTRMDKLQTPLSFEQFMKEIGQANSQDKESRNRLRIEKTLLKLFPGLNNLSFEDGLEQSLYKKFRLADENGQQKYSKIIGYKHSDFRKIRKYQVEIDRIPPLHCEFEDSKQMDALFPEEKARKLVQKNKSGNNQDLYQVENNPFQFRTRPLQTESYQHYQEIPFQEKVKEKERFWDLEEEERNRVEQSLLRKNWEMVTKQIVRLYKYTQRERFEKEKNMKSFAFGCSKEVRRKAQKSQRIQKEFGFRAKKIYREVAQYWRKREREVNEIKKKKEKLELEIKKKQEEEREVMLQKKRLEFLMRQSDIYAHFMAKKLGINQSEEHSGPMKEPAEEEDQAIMNIQKMINERRMELTDYDRETLQQDKHQRSKEQDLVRSEELVLDLSKVDNSQLNTLLQTPSAFKGQLKEYQLNGLRWLDNLYEQGINGILADEMGLGKTIQAIALLTHLSEQKNNWGPHLVVAPSSTLYNWQQEITRFSPKLKILPYWGNLKQRKMLRKFFNGKRSIGTEQGAFHVVISSYNIVVADEKSFQRMKWQYVILDEAQAIKCINSQRWKTLLSFQSRNKLLLTGTPIQNTMAELWALLHFIMPKLFDSHEQFQEWFSKDIEAHSVDQKQLNQHQLQRLHSILKPFMLRRIKKDVEHEIAEKNEILVYCQMTQRQKELYHQIKSKLPVQEFFKMFESKARVEDLMNLVMQFRKVCNHPELFERRTCRSPFQVASMGHYSGHQVVGYGQMKLIVYNNRNPLQVALPKVVYDDTLYTQTTHQYVMHRFCIYDVHHQLHSNAFSFVTLMGLCPQDLLDICVQDLPVRMLAVAHYLRHNQYRLPYLAPSSRHILVINSMLKVFSSQHNYQELRLLPLSKSTADLKVHACPVLVKKSCYIPKAMGNLPRVHCVSAHFQQHRAVPALHHSLLFGGQGQEGRLVPGSLKEGEHRIEIPDYMSLIADSTKLKYLDRLLLSLKRDGHRCLIFCQMTKMMDILEDYLSKKKYRFFRLDGSSNIADRRDMVTEYQNNRQIFVFLLSTRAGGLGITLTAADTVIFYDNDWNPTMDAQATDRAHRIGQTERVTVYKLITKGTIEERIVKRAQQKQNVQSTVYSGGAFKGDIFKPENVKELLFDDHEIDMGEANKFITHGGGKQKHKKLKRDKTDKAKRKKDKEELPEDNNYDLAKLMDKEDSD